jgi:hypothetical protein
LTVCAAGLGLWGNLLTGTLPSVIGLLTNLREFLDVHTTDVLSTCCVSKWYPFTNSLVPVQFRHYLFSRVPILLITELLSLYDNVLNGTIPTELALLNNLEVLYLHSNRLTGPVPTSSASLPRLSKSNHSCSGAHIRHY